MFDWRSMDEWRRLWRYYQAGIVNTLFGYGLFVLFVTLGWNIYLSQVTSHFLGMVFNYYTYSRYAFAGHSGSKLKFAASYAFNYVLGLGALAVATRFTSSPYLAGLASVIFVSIVNYFILKRLVFRRPART